MVVVTRQQCSKIEGSCCNKPAAQITKIPQITRIIPVCTAYDLRPRPYPSPNYYEPRVNRRKWTPKRKQKGRQKPYARRAKNTPLEQGDHAQAMEAAKRRRRGEPPEPMHAEAAAFEHEQCDAECENLANDRIVEAVENMCTAFGIVVNKEGEYPNGWNVENSADIYARVFPEYAHEFSEGCSDSSLTDLTADAPDTQYRIPVIEGGVVTPSWEDARCVVKQEMDDDRYAVPQDLPKVSASQNETPVYSDDNVALNSIYETRYQLLEEQSDCSDGTEEICSISCTPCGELVPDVKNAGVSCTQCEELVPDVKNYGVSCTQCEEVVPDVKNYGVSCTQCEELVPDVKNYDVSCTPSEELVPDVKNADVCCTPCKDLVLDVKNADVSCTPCEELVPDVKDAGVTNEPEEYPIDNDDVENPTNNNLNMFFGANARNNWPSPTVFPREKKSD